MLHFYMVTDYDYIQHIQRCTCIPSYPLYLTKILSENKAYIYFFDSNEYICCEILIMKSEWNEYHTKFLCEIFEEI